MNRITNINLKHKPRFKIMPVTNTKIAIGYTRLSDRAATGDETSLERQEAEIRSWCERNGLTLVQVYSDVGKSGRKLKRAGLNAAVSECVLRGAVLVSYAFDRIARNTKVIDRLKSERVVFRCLDLPEMNETLLPLVQCMAEIYSRQVSDKMRAYHAHRKSEVAAGRAEPHPVPTYRPEPDVARESIAHARDTRIARTSKRAGYVWNHIQPMLAEGKSIREITKILNDTGIKASRGGAWHPAGVQRIIARHTA